MVRNTPIGITNMKYIRTKTNIFEVVEETELVYKVIGASRDRNNVYSKSKCQTEVIDSGDTIEELCDEFVIGNCYHFDKPFIFPKEKSSNPLLEIYTHYDNDVICYGAIWTEWGLKYVAKMNEDGEMKLL